MIWPFKRKTLHVANPEATCIEHPVTFVASPYKTATTSVGRALITMGVHEADMLYHGKLLREYRHLIKAVNTLARGTTSARDFLDNRGEDVRVLMADFTPHVQKFDVFSDAPLGHVHIHPFVRKAIAPQGKFIWVHRDEDSWFSSVRRWEEGHPKTYPRHTLWVDEPERRPTELRRLWARHLGYFEALAQACPQDCLQIHIDDLKDYSKLAAFYGVEAPQVELKRYNVNEAKAQDN
jgi:hypothetical protein